MHTWLIEYSNGYRNYSLYQKRVIQSNLDYFFSRNIFPEGSLGLEFRYNYDETYLDDGGIYYGPLGKKSEKEYAVLTVELKNVLGEYSEIPIEYQEQINEIINSDSQELILYDCKRSRLKKEVCGLLPEILGHTDLFNSTRKDLPVIYTAIQNDTVVSDITKPEGLVFPNTMEHIRTIQSPRISDGVMYGIYNAALSEVHNFVENTLLRLYKEMYPDINGCIPESSFYRQKIWVGTDRKLWKNIADKNPKEKLVFSAPWLLSEIDLKKEIFGKERFGVSETYHDNSQEKFTYYILDLHRPKILSEFSSSRDARQAFGQITNEKNKIPVLDTNQEAGVRSASEGRKKLLGVLSEDGISAELSRWIYQKNYHHYLGIDPLLHYIKNNLTNENFSINKKIIFENDIFYYTDITNLRCERNVSFEKYIDGILEDYRRINHKTVILDSLLDLPLLSEFLEFYDEKIIYSDNYVAVVAGKMSQEFLTESLIRIKLSELPMDMEMPETDIRVPSEGLKYTKKDGYFVEYNKQEIGTFDLNQKEILEKWERGDFLGIWGRFYYIKTGKISCWI